MSLPPDQPLPAPPVKPKLTPEERRTRQADRLITIRLRMLTGRVWREGDVALLEAAVARLGVQVSGL